MGVSGLADQIRIRKSDDQMIIDHCPAALSENRHKGEIFVLLWLWGLINHV